MAPGLQNTGNMATNEKTALRFFWNGIKVGKGPLQLCSYSLIKAWRQGTREIPTQITIYGKGYKDFSPEINAAFVVTDDSDLQTDYVENVRIRVLPSHPRFFAVAAALRADIDRSIARCEKKGRPDDAEDYRRRAAELEVIVRDEETRRAEIAGERPAVDPIAAAMGARG